jgi:hypothetical protein
MLSSRRRAEVPLCAQTQSPFFSKLSPELRVLIYHFAYPFEAVHISCRNRVPYKDESGQDSRLGSIPCLTNHHFSQFELDRYNEPDVDWGLGHQTCLQAFKSRYQKRSLTDRISSLRKSKRPPFLQMMLTCRRV